jgi:hypothetical protein
MIAAAFDPLLECISSEASARRYERPEFAASISPVLVVARAKQQISDQEIKPFCLTLGIYLLKLKNLLL